MPSTKTPVRARIDADVKASVRPMPFVRMPAERRQALELWIRESVARLRADREPHVTERVHHENTLSGKRNRPAPRRGASNLSTPLTIWAAAGTRARMDENLFGSNPLVTARPMPGAFSDTDESVTDIVNDLRTWLELEITNPRALGGREAGRKIIADNANYGTAGLKVYLEPDDVRLLPPRPPAPGDDPALVKPRQQRIAGRPKWEYISLIDLLWWDGYGTDTQRMPFIGHEYDRTWADIQKWVALGYYEPEAVRQVEAFYEDIGRQGSVARQHTASSPAHAREHTIAEIYLDYPVDDSNVPAALLLDYHIKAQQILRVTWNFNPLGVRPIFMGQFDLNPDPTKATGQGVCQKLRGAQDETDEIHNITVEAGKHAAVHLTGLRFGSAAADELGGGERMLPGDVYVTEDPEEDVTTKPMGDPKAAEFLIALENNTRAYVMRMLGFDEGRLGKVESGKRVPGFLGMAISREGRVPIQHATNSLSDMFTEALYLTMELYRQHLPSDSLVAALGPAAAARLQQLVFSTGSASVREQFILTVSAQDAASVDEARRGDLSILTQFLFGFYDRVTQQLQLAVQAPPEAREIIVEILAKMQKSVKLLLGNIDSIPNPEEVIPQVAEMIQQFDSANIASAGAGAPTREDRLEQTGAGVV